MAIEKVSAGGLLNGYGRNIFAPNDTLTVAQMATIVATARGYLPLSIREYWAYDYIDYCVNKAECLPSLGEISNENYNVPCSRELAVYMLMKGIGINEDKAERLDSNFDANDIADFDTITRLYQETVEEAYKQGILAGTQDGTFGPEKGLTRAEAAVLLNRIGCTKVGDAAAAK